MSKVPRNIDEQIRQAMEKGEFDNLPGKGKPLDLTQFPHEDPGWRIAYRMLKENGYTLPWIETRRSIELDIERANKSLQQNWEWRKGATTSRSLLQAEREWQQAIQRFHEQVTNLNKRIRDYNLEIPSSQFQRHQIDAEREIQKITNPSN
jgi:DnaJ family protein C protein 28